MTGLSDPRARIMCGFRTLKNQTGRTLVPHFHVLKPGVLRQEIGWIHHGIITILDRAGNTSNVSPYHSPLRKGPDILVRIPESSRATPPQERCERLRFVMVLGRLDGFDEPDGNIAIPPRGEGMYGGHPMYNTIVSMLSCARYLLD
jgi:hypothetical protein